MTERSLHVGADDTAAQGVHDDDAHLPSGTVTFVFTDIEGSTQLFRRIGDRYAPLLERHRELLREAWHAHGGVVLGTEGDAFFVAFQDVNDALQACDDAQRSLETEPWPPDEVIRVRMGVHSGLAWPREGNYVAIAVHQAARVVSAAHGGQVIVTADAAAHAGSSWRELPTSSGSDASLPERAATRCLSSLGRFRVRDFEGPVELFQLANPTLAHAFPSLRVLPADSHNIVVPPTPLVGRGEDLEVLEGLVGGSRLVTVVGPGGVGKTRLASELGLRCAGTRQDGVWFVDLTSLREGDLIPEAIAAAVGASVSGSADVWGLVTDHLSARDALLVVDNCEHVRASAAERIHELLQLCPSVHVLATSREPLGLIEERVWRAEPLDPSTAAVDLFLERAGLGSSLDPVDEGLRATIEALCHELDGLPLAIELAASRCDVLTPAEELEQLRKRRDVLRTTDPTLAERQRSMAAAIAWSHDLLNANEQQAFCRLGIFADGFDLEAAAAAVAGPNQADESGSAGLIDPYDVPELVWALLSKSLVVKEPAGGATRYRMLETIRAYAGRELDRSGSMLDVGRCLAQFYLDTFGPHLDRQGPEMTSARAREADNLRALVPALATGDPELAQMVASSVVADARQTSYHAALAEGRSLLAMLPEPGLGRVALLDTVAFLAAEAQRSDEASELLAEAEEMAKTVGVPPWLEGRLEQERGIIELINGDPRRARELALAGLEQEPTERGRANLLELLMIAAIDLGDFEEARMAGEAALELATPRGSLEIIGMLQSSLAEAAWRAGDRVMAARWQLESLRIGMQTGRGREIAFALIIAARLAESSGELGSAVRLQSSADAMLAELGVSLYPEDRAQRDALMEACQQRLAQEEFASEVEGGAAMPVEQGVLAATLVLTSTIDGAEDSP